MNISLICQNISNYNVYNSRNENYSNFGIKMKNPIKSDTVSFTSREKQLTPQEKMRCYAIELLDKNDLQKGQKLHITAESKYLPFVDVLSAEAYKRGSGLVFYNIIEPEIEELKSKYDITEDFDYKKTEISDLKKNNALFITFDDDKNPFLASGLTDEEIKAEQLKLRGDIPKEVYDEFKINPKEIFKDALDIHEGQPVSITAEREHMPFVEKLVEYLYSENGSKLVDVIINDNNKKNMLLYGDDSLLTEFTDAYVEARKERYEKDVAALYLAGSDPKEYDGIDSERITKNSRARMDRIRKYYNLSTNNVPWLVYYAPTTMSSREAYPEYDNPIERISRAYKDANKINRMGNLDEHINSLSHRAEKMNEIMRSGYRTLHYVSVDDDGKPDGKTDFRVTMSPKSIFNAARSDMPKYGHSPLVNIPTEEVFTAPQADTAEGVISATMPLALNGKVIDGIRFEFKEGKITDIHADTNEDLLRNHINSNENADRLGEVALVAGSPIAATGRIFYETLLDENAACHLAIGNAYPDTVEGALDIEDYSEMEEYLKDLKINNSPTHIDFMVGGKNVNIYAENKETGDVVTVIKNDKFLL